MSRRWTLYWVSSGTEEDCFVVARNSRSAVRVEVEMNGFDPDRVEAERICVIPKSVEQEYFSGSEEVHLWPWYVYGRAFFEGVGAEFREIDGQLQMLLEEVVYEVDELRPCAMRKIYSIGRRAIEEFDSIPEYEQVNLAHEDPDYLGSIAPFVNEIIGRCLVRCQEIEDNLANSFIFSVPDQNKSKEKTINDIRNEWKKLTFGQLTSMIKRDWDMIPEVDYAFDTFKSMRNTFVHGLTTDPRFDISTKWGVMELIPFLQFFDLHTKIMVKASRASLAASLGVGAEVFGETKDLSELVSGERFKEDAALFFEMFWIKGEPWDSK